MRPRFLDNRPQTVAIEHLGAWRDLLGEHAQGRECRAWLYGPETVWFYLVPEGMGDQIREYMNWLDRVKLGPQIYPLSGEDILVAIAENKAAQEYIKKLVAEQANIRFFDAKAEHLRFAEDRLGVTDWSQQVSSCHPDKRKYTCKVETRRLLEVNGMAHALLPWAPVSLGDDPFDVVVDRIQSAASQVKRKVRLRGLCDVVDCVLLKHPSLASSAGIQKIQSREDIIDFFEKYGQQRCPELIVEAGVSEHESVSLQTWIGQSGDIRLGSSVQLIKQEQGRFEYRGNLMGYGAQVISEPVMVQMLKIAEVLNEALRGQGVRGYSVIDYLVDSNGQVWPLESNLRVTATVYLRSLLDQVAPKMRQPCFGLIRNIDIPPYGASSLSDVFFRLDKLLHNGVTGVFPCMIETLQTEAPQLCLVSTDSSVTKAEEALDSAVRRLTLPIDHTLRELGVRKMQPT